MNYIRLSTNTFASPDLIAEIDPNLLNALSEIGPALLNAVPDFRHTEDVQDRHNEAAAQDGQGGCDFAANDMAWDEDQHKSCRSLQKPN